MHGELRDGPGLIGDLWDRQTSLVTEAAHAADLAEMADALSSQASLQDLLPAIPRELCRRLGFRRGRIWLESPDQAPLTISWPPGGVGGAATALTPLPDEAALARGPAPKSLTVPLRAWSGEVCGCVHLGAPVPERTLSRRDLAWACRCGEAVSTVLHRAQLAETLAETRRLLDSKTVAVRESHHRIKNNLQALAGLMTATGTRAHSRGVREALGESATRVHAIAAVHEALLADGGTQADVQALVETLMRHAFRPPVEQDGRVQIGADVQPCRLPARWASSLALVINELVTNALRHAFPDGCGEIAVTFRCNGEAVLTVADTGGALPPGPLEECRFGLGLHIVNSIVCNDLGGAFRITGGARTTARACFPLPVAAAPTSAQPEPYAKMPRGRPDGTYARPDRR